MHKYQVKTFILQKNWDSVKMILPARHFPTDPRNGVQNGAETDSQNGSVREESRKVEKVEEKKKFSSEKKSRRKRRFISVFPGCLRGKWKMVVSEWNESAKMSRRMNATRLNERDASLQRSHTREGKKRCKHLIGKVREKSRTQTRVVGTASWSRY